MLPSLPSFLLPSKNGFRDESNGVLRGSLSQGGVTLNWQRGLLALRCHDLCQIVLWADFNEGEDCSQVKVRDSTNGSGFLKHWFLLIFVLGFSRCVIAPACMLHDA